MAKGGRLKITKVSIQGWRHIDHVSIDVHPDASLICLVGENGTGKSGILDIISQVLANMGIGHGGNTQRSNPLLDPHEISVALSFKDQYDEIVAMAAKSGVPDRYRYDLTDWTGEVIFRSRLTESGENDFRELTLGGIDRSFQVGGNDGSVFELLNQEYLMRHLHLDASRSFWPLDRNTLLQFQSEGSEWSPYTERMFAFRTSKDLFSQWLAWLIQQEAEQGARLLGELRRSNYEPAVPFRDQDTHHNYSQLISEALPYLKFIQTDQKKNSIIFQSRGIDVDFFNLSGGEKEICYILGQIDRFNLSHGILLIDEPELHLHAGLVRTWMTYLQRVLDKGQVWTATHSFESVEVAGADNTFVIERDIGSIRTVGGGSLAERPILPVLTAALGIPGLSTMGKTFYIVEGGDKLGERQRFYDLCGSSGRVQFLPMGKSKDDVITSLGYYTRLAELTDNLVVIRGIVDADFDSLMVASELLNSSSSVYQLPVHEIENIFLHPESLRIAADTHGCEGVDVHALLRSQMDRLAGKWVFDKAKYNEYFAWKEELGEQGIHDMRREWGKMNWEDVELLQHDGRSLGSDVPDRVESAMLAAVEEFRRQRSDNEWWKHMFGKQIQAFIAPMLGFHSDLSLEKYLITLWSRGGDIIPEELVELRKFVGSRSILVS